MELDDRLYALFEGKAKKATVETLSLGLGYTAVTTANGGIGIAYTYFERKTGCSMSGSYVDYENRPALDLLRKIKEAHPIERTMALALINALNHESALQLPEDPNNENMFDRFGIMEGARVAMVGAFGPLIKICKDRGVALEVIDLSRGFGEKEPFYEKLKTWAEVLFLTSTSILNGTTEDVMKHAGAGVKTIMLGPSTPMVAEAFEHLPISMLGGTVPVEKEKVLKAVRHGTGTPVISKFGKKVHLDLQPSPKS